MICKNCKKVNSDDARFCIHCGSDLSNSNVAVEEGSVDKYFAEKKSAFIEEAKSLADSEMKQGIIWFVIALVITFGSYLFTSEGGTYYVFWGAMIYGIYRLIRGFWYKLNPESLLQKAEKEAKKDK
ncbi:hypothetical protein A2774_02000 [Candidatus Roizmanbacteria bacterium RIFCSPHIGHO2_01_FULL_39_12c]|uniref:Zinc-ribbon domain-containing protein n=1 Tax=Candidatus Roizmanbacteria bacterium RIFCSPHIGHO2_01_FULL_39_12c TaxID=1802031 RepID=A0A1F7GFQ6_9BACT|nr:MAG: hypothetical protein A2774_02000 [Candidatus Roizmanbacteria bacterium RIFCSPHIGHO2_01_FULL_39_12c]OGK47220.1 MAG: hypothetical protein A2963_04100 [Candidatus Roizmanbacteria bacterium RIFCSPLOWO2_01_FULL_40_13]